MLYAFLNQRIHGFALYRNVVRISKSANNYKISEITNPLASEPSRVFLGHSWIPSALQTTRNPKSMMGPAHPVQVLSVRHLALAVLVLQKALRHASGDWRETVLAGGSVLPQKQRRKGRGAYFSAESGTEHDVPPSRLPPERQASSILEHVSRRGCLRDTCSHVCTL